MNNDYMFEDEVDEEAAAELAKKRAMEEQKASEEEEKKSSQQPDYNTNNGDNGFNNNGQQNNSYNNYNSYNGYNPNYGQGPNYYGNYNPYKKTNSTGKASASMILGVLSLVFFCSCINVVTAIIALILGISYLRNNDLSVGKYRAIAGIVTAAISLVMFFGSYTYISSNADLEKLLEDDGLRYFYSQDGIEEFNEDFFHDDFFEDDFFSDYNSNYGGDTF